MKFFEKVKFLTLRVLTNAIKAAVASTSMRMTVSMSKSLDLFMNKKLMSCLERNRAIIDYSITG